MYSNELYHYGVIGMKWGMHRARSHAKAAAKYRSLAEKNPDRSSKYLAKANRHDAKSSYTYKSHSTNKYGRKIFRIDKRLNGDRQLSDKARSRLERKKELYSYRLNRSKELDSREQSYAKRVKLGANIATRLLTLGRVGGKSYQQYIAMAGAQGKGNLGAKFIAAKTVKNNSKVRDSRKKNNVGFDPITGRIRTAMAKSAYLRIGEADHMNEYDERNKEKRRKQKE